MCVCVYGGETRDARVQERTRRVLPCGAAAHAQSLALSCPAWVGAGAVHRGRGHPGRGDTMLVVRGQAGMWACTRAGGKMRHGGGREGGTEGMPTDHKVGGVACALAPRALRHTHQRVDTHRGKEGAKEGGLPD